MSNQTLLHNPLIDELVVVYFWTGPYPLIELDKSASCGNEMF